MKVFAFLFYSLLSVFLIADVSAKQPDILMIAIDDLRPMLGCYGDTRIRTPNIDALASRGVVFDRAYCQYAKCGTSRLSIMSGLRPDSVGVFSNNAKDLLHFRKQNPCIFSLARHLKESGYHTQSFGKIYHDGWDNAADWSVAPMPGREREMWEVTDPNKPNLPTNIAERLECPAIQSPDVADDHLFAGRMTRAVVETLADKTIANPRFVAVGFRRPHLPFVAPKRYFDTYSPDDSWLASNRTPDKSLPVMAWFNSDGYVGSAKKIGLQLPLRPNRQQAIAWNGYELRSYLGVPNQGEIQESLQLQLVHAYAACISYVDAQVGKLLEQLQASGKSDNTIVILWSDHGWHLGEHSAWGKMTNYEVATRVPLIIAAPDVKPARTDTIAELVDLYPTICELTEVSAPTHLQGESLVSVLENPKLDSNSFALSQYSRFRESYMGRAIRTDRYRFVLWEENATGEVAKRELYDHSVDPGENHNLADDEQFSELCKRLETQQRAAFQGQ